MRTSDITKLAEKYGWERESVKQSGMLRYVRYIESGRQIIEIWPSRMTVATMLNHPQQGKTKLYRRRVRFNVLKRIFENPRLHTTGGYKTKANKRNKTELSR